MPTSRGGALCGVAPAIILELMAEALVATQHLSCGAKGALEELSGYVDRHETPPMELRATLAGSPFHALDALGLEPTRPVL